MQGFEIESSYDLRLVRKWPHDFAVADDKSEIVQIPRAVGRKIWLCLYAESQVRHLDWIWRENINRWQERLHRLIVESNCHWIVDWVMTNKLIISQWYDLQFPLNGIYRARFVFENFGDAIEKWGFPIFATHWTNNYFCHDHSAVILWTFKKNEFVVFEKEWDQGFPFRIYLEDRAKIEDTYSRFAVYGKPL